MDRKKYLLKLKKRLIHLLDQLGYVFQMLLVKNLMREIPIF